MGPLAKERRRQHRAVMREKKKRDDYERRVKFEESFCQSMMIWRRIDELRASEHHLTDELARNLPQATRAILSKRRRKTRQEIHALHVKLKEQNEAAK